MKETNDLEFINVLDDVQIKIVDKLAYEIWNEYFVPIIGKNQVDYMIKKFQCFDSIKTQLKNNYSYYILNYKNNNVGYTCISQQNNSLFLSKLYILKAYRGNRLASYTIDFLVKICKSNSLNKIWLTVNKYNNDTISIYKKLGFVIVKSQITDIGNGFVMDDYIMEKYIN